MNYKSWIKLAASLVLGLALVLLGISPLSTQAALAQVPPSGTFVATGRCEAPRAINGRNPGNVHVSIGQRYEAVGFNSPEQNFILIKVPGAAPERRWVRASCGTFSEIPMPSTTPSQALLPFFDAVNNPEEHGFPRGKKEDITPPVPELSEFDQAILRTCGPFDSKVEAESFRQLMLAHKDVLQNIKEAVNGELVQGRQAEEEFLDDLTAIWSEREGFEHIFCGEKKLPKKAKDDIDGLHFVGRYLQLQNEGIGGRLAQNLQKEEVIPGAVFTLGVVIKHGDDILEDDLKGYPLVSNAEELLVDATRAFKAFKVQGNDTQACLYPVVDEETRKSFKAVFVKDRKAIVTFYPDATPDRNTPSCS